MDPRVRMETIQLIQQSPHLQSDLAAFPITPGQLVPQFALTTTGGTQLLLPQTIIPVTQRNCVRLRGLPFESTVADILTFLGEYARHIVYQGVHIIYNSQVSRYKYKSLFLFI